MVCRNWSLSSDENFTGLCSMTMRAESDNNTVNCVVCAAPLIPNAV